LSVYEAMKVRGVTPGAKVVWWSVSPSIYFIRIPFTLLVNVLFWLKCLSFRILDGLN
jgi:hypothetical protein